jgi:hypothetical protein
MSKVKWMAGSCFAMALALLAWGCAGKAGPAPAFSTVTGQHPADWIQVHYAGYVQTPDQCRSCHGSTTDPAQAGGIAKVSCFSCHASGVDHPAGWADHLQHGRNGAQLAPVATNDTTVPVMAGMSHCQKCHGSSYNNGIAVSCLSCHTTAPHPPKPWVNASTLPHRRCQFGHQAAHPCPRGNGPGLLQQYPVPRHGNPGRNHRCRHQGRPAPLMAARTDNPRPSDPRRCPIRSIQTSTQLHPVHQRFTT